MRAFFKYYLFWLLFFLVQKPVFMLYNLSQMSGVTWKDWLAVIWHAFPLDLSVASYITVVFGLLIVGEMSYPTHVWRRIADVYTGLILAVALLIFISDTGVFPYWGFHLDRTVFMFLATPQEVLACAPWWVWLLVSCIWIVSWDVLYFAYRRWMISEKERKVQSWPVRLGKAVGMLLLTGLLFLPIRGSLTTSTMNTGRVYFSDRQILNMSAINPVFNLIESLSESSFDTRRYTYMPTEEAQQAVEQLLPAISTEHTEFVLTMQRPNIIFFILESFSSNAWEAMPCLQRLAREGVYFSQAYASSFRTDRGVVAALSGFPGQPTSSLMTQPAKSQYLPQLGKSLAAEGYQLKFWYGGDEDFTNMRSYLINGGFVDRVNDHSFPVTQRLSKWGVHDHLLFAKAAQEIKARQSDAPTLDVILSLSSHEPFEVPVTQRFENPYLNSVAYTDSCIGAFVDSLRQSAVWDKTLLVFVADHGYPYPAGVQNYEPRRYHIPVVWAGGAVKVRREIDKLCSQIDVVPTLLSQMGIDHSAYTFGKNSMDTTVVPFAFYSFNDGFALLTEQDSVVIDAKADKCIMGNDEEMEYDARAFMQRVMETIDSWR